MTNPPPEHTLPHKPVEQPSALDAGLAAAVAPESPPTPDETVGTGQWYDFACVYAVASGKDANKKEEYAQRAVELLQKAIAKRYKDAAHMAKDTDLDPLRERDDFKKLLAELEKK